jgi:Fe-S cluster assembly ATP-binding protein
MLEVHGLRASINGTAILNGIDLTVNAGELHAIMGPNGSGKSTLANVLAGNPMYKVTGGTTTFDGSDLLKVPPEERARAGIFLSFQHPSEIPGVRLDHFLRGSVNAIRKSHNEEEIGVLQFDKLLKERAQIVEMDSSLTKRPVNEGFSGGEKKRSEILQMALLKPKLAILDEVDSGLDVDALRIVAGGINQLRTPDNAMILVTHYQRILNYVVPDYVHVLVNGRIVMSGGKELALEIESKGYDWVAEATDAMPSSG